MASSVLSPKAVVDSICGSTSFNIFYFFLNLRFVIGFLFLPFVFLYISILVSLLLATPRLPDG